MSNVLRVICSPLWCPEAERTLFIERKAALDATRIKEREARIEAKKAREVQDRLERSKLISVYL